MVARIIIGLFLPFGVASSAAARANVTMAGARPNPMLSLGMSSMNPKLGVGGGHLRLSAQLQTAN